MQLSSGSSIHGFTRILLQVVQSVACASNRTALYQSGRTSFLTKATLNFGNAAFLCNSMLPLPLHLRLLQTFVASMFREKILLPHPSCSKSCTYLLNLYLNLHRISQHRFIYTFDKKIWPWYSTLVDGPCIHHYCSLYCLLSDAKLIYHLSDSYSLIPAHLPYLCPCLPSSSAPVLFLMMTIKVAMIIWKNEIDAASAESSSSALLSIYIVAHSTTILRSWRMPNRSWLTVKAQGSALSWCTQAIITKPRHKVALFKGPDNVHG